MESTTPSPFDQEYRMSQRLYALQNEIQRYLHLIRIDEQNNRQVPNWVREDLARAEAALEKTKIELEPLKTSKRQ